VNIPDASGFEGKLKFVLHEVWHFLPYKISLIVNIMVVRDVGKGVIIWLGQAAESICGFEYFHDLEV
jgi:hypothetical protein